MSTEIKSVADSLGWGSGLFNGTATPSLYWGARTIFHPGSSRDEKTTIKRNRTTGAVVREFKNGPARWNYKTITEKAWLDFVPDRLGWAGALYAAEDFDTLKERSEFKAFTKWHKEVAMVAVTKWIQNQDSSSADVFELVRADFGVTYKIRTSMNASYGYCYVASWSEPQ